MVVEDEEVMEMLKKQGILAKDIEKSNVSKDFSTPSAPAVRGRGRGRGSAK